jgi:hypothetical protein
MSRPTLALVVLVAAGAAAGVAQAAMLLLWGLP